MTSSVANHRELEPASFENTAAVANSSGATFPGATFSAAPRSDANSSYSNGRFSEPTPTGPVTDRQARSSEPVSTALAALASAVFVGSQLLAAASVGRLGVWGLVVALSGTAILGWLYREQLRDKPVIATIFTKAKAQRLLASPEVLILPLSLGLLSVVPSIERQGHGAIGLTLRLAIGIFVVASVSGHAASWLAMAALITLVFHPWDHPIGVAALFTALALLVLALANLARRSTAPNRHSSPTSSPTSSPSSSPTSSPSGTPISQHSLRRRRQQHWAAGSLIAVAIGGGLLLEPAARDLAWRSNQSEFGLNGKSTSLVSRGGTFRALTRSPSLELAYKPTRSNEVVLRVYTYAQAPVFLRAQTFDTWTGKTWIEAREPKREEPIQIGLWDARPYGVDRVTEQFNLNTYSPEAAARGLVRTVVQAQTKLNGVVPVPTEALGAIWMLDGADQSNQFLSSTMFWRTDGTASSESEKGASPIYTVLHDPRAGGPIDDGSAKDSTIRKDYPELFLQNDISPRAEQLAKEIVGSAATSAEKVQRIRTWMTTNIAYNLTAKDPGSGADPIDYLLFSSKEGSCTHFATTTAALLRSVGIPTRISTGFVAQEQPRFSQFVVRGKDAHAWAEVPLETGDWLPVDTTIGAREVFPPENSGGKLLARVALGAIGVFVLVGAWMGIKRGLKRRMTAKPSVFVEELSRLARRLNVPVLADCSTAKLAAQLDQRLAQQLGAQTPEAERAGGLGLVNHKNTARQLVWNVGALSAFGQRLEASSFGTAPVDLHDGSQIIQSAFRRARSQRLQRWRHQIAYVVRGHWLHR